MAYILFVNPNILGEAGMPRAQFSWQLHIGAGISTVMMGFYAKLPSL